MSQIFLSRGISLSDDRVRTRRASYQIGCWFDEDNEVSDETVRPLEEDVRPPVVTSAAEFGIYGPVDVLTLVNHSGQDLEVDLGDFIGDLFCTDLDALSIMPDMSSMDLSITGTWWVFENNKEGTQNVFDERVGKIA